ncbi:MAG TPA: NapC/NirT family cytochrome c [bacterium]
MAQNEKRGFASLLYNRISYLGGMLAAIMIVIFLLMLFISTLTGAENPYFGLVTFIVIPPFIILGLLLIPIGVWWERRRRIRTGRATEAIFPVIDLNIRKNRIYLTIFNVSVFSLLLLAAVGAYNAYHYTETTSFCGTLCHEVMNPEFTAYERSPHARVGCVDCHVGSGASFYVKSKLSGLYQVYAALANVYPKPIPTPIKNLRPAQETCEQCHWPAAFYGEKQTLRNHYLYDKHSTPWSVNMLIKIGGGSPGTAQTTGIHWHMNIANQVEIIARDRAQQDIPWIRMSNFKTGIISEYQDVSNPLTQAELDSLPKRRMDCMDCHNRPTHIFRSPNYSVNLALDTQRLDDKLPSIKEYGVKVLTSPYKTTAEAMTGISQQMWALYDEKNFPDTTIFPASVEQAIKTLQEIYSTNFFPEMGVKWDVYTDDIGHINSRGCHRCHDGNHKTSDGKAITRECNACHLILSQGRPDSLEIATNLVTGLEFRHPVDIGDAWKETGCFECHTGAQP